jgi:benzoate transport
MNKYQWFVVALATALMALDGYDVQAMAFTANSVTADFDLTGQQLGFLLSGGLIGMALGAAAIGPFADRFGRRPLLLTAITINGTGLFLSATASSMPELLIWRIVTGLGVGGILVSGTVLISEYTNAKHRGLSLSIYAAGYPVGATLGGLASIPLIGTFGWQAVFVLGGLVTLVSFAVVARWMPESLDFLAAKSATSSGAAARAAADRIVTRLDIDSPYRLGGSTPQDGAGTNRYTALLVKSQRSSTLMLWAMFFLVMFTFYFANTWTPQLLTEVGFSPQEGIFGGIMLTSGGVVGAVTYGLCASRWDVRRVMVVFAALAAVVLIVFISSTGVLAVALGAGVLLGVILNGCVSALYTIAPMTYAPATRSTGVGMALGIGRLGAIIAPIIVGGLLDLGWTPFALYAGAAGVILLAAVAVLRIQLHQAQAEDLEPADSPAAADAPVVERASGTPEK